MSSEEQEAEAVRLARQAAEADIMATADEREAAWLLTHGPLGKRTPDCPNTIARNVLGLE